MNRFIQTCLGALAVMVSAGSSGEVHAKEVPRFTQIPGVLTRVAAADDNTVYALDSGDFRSGFGHRIRSYDTVLQQWKPRLSTDGFGTSLAVDATLHQVFTISLDKTVRRRRAGQTSWEVFPRIRCEGGDLVPRQEVGQNNVSASDGYVHVISGTTGNPVYTWNFWDGNCWSKLPALPSGVAIEIAQAAQNPKGIWAINPSMQIFHWNGARWASMAGGLARGVGYARVIGSDGASLWQWSPTTGFTRVTAWAFGPIHQMQRSANANGYTVVQPGGQLWWYGPED